MNRNGKITIALFILTIFAILPLTSNTIFAEETLKDILSKKYKEERDICLVVKKAIAEGMNVKEVTKTSIEMGYDACLVVRCAVEAKGNLEQIIIGALEAGATSDVCSRCALEGGADPRELARIIESEMSPIETRLPGGSSGGGYLSPSSPTSF